MPKDKKDEREKPLLTKGKRHKGVINLQLRNKKMLRNESCDPLKIDAAVLQVSKPV